ncbi:MgtC/SapB family protein [Acidovorax sp. SDU_ACID1]|uniref:MgtC/SapB family protein n=1 Tax=Acidovorax sp. SDU_ACID1 TaxID=3136632 RepID=UPI003873579E
MSDQASAADTVFRTIAQEFADLSDIEQATRVATRLFLAALFGGALGFEREASGKAAGIRTHMLVAMGAAMFVMISQLMGAQANELSRVIQGVVAGVGFLGAGAILKSSKDGHEHIQGLTTAAGIWFTAAIGVAVGVGKESAALICTVLALMVLAVVPWVTKDGPSGQRK